jgi:hypothetical protein
MENELPSLSRWPAKSAIDGSPAEAKKGRGGGRHSGIGYRRAGGDQWAVQGREEAAKSRWERSRGSEGVRHPGCLMAAGNEKSGRLEAAGRLRECSAAGRRRGWRTLVGKSVHKESLSRADPVGIWQLRWSFPQVGRSGPPPVSRMTVSALR